ncbi:MAG: hypothetical protein ACI83L_000072 [Cryomorphaceae bacterium]|jgi:hypothetical protein
MGALHSWFCHLFEIIENGKKMMDLIPYFAGFVTILFGLGFYFGIQEFKDQDHE